MNFAMASGLNKKYFWNKGFDPRKLVTGIAAALAKHVPGSGPEATPDGVRLVNAMSADARITDIRYMAYMLATACKEAREIRKYPRPVLDKKHKPVVNSKTGQPVMKDVKLWSVFQPIEESGHGAGRDYFRPVKVAAVGANVMITEQDGDQFTVMPNGTYTGVRTKRGMPTRGSSATGAVSKVYQEAAGVEHAYFGRGLVQLTWWNTYAAAGVELGLGLELLTDPDKLLDFDISYKVMTGGMLEGKSFANGMKCSQYFTDGTTDYWNARNMVNGNDKLQEIVDLANAFEALLMDARVQA